MASEIVVLPVDAPAGTAGQRIDRQPLTREDANPFWSPDSDRLAYVRGTTIVIHTVAGHGADVLLRAPRSTVYAGGVAWSPDGRRLAVALAQPALQTTPRTLLVAVGSPSSTQWSRVTVRFPAGALGLRMGNIPISTPGMDPVWTPDGQGFLFSTVLIGEGPPNITGIWEVGSGGGVAHLVIGTAWGVRHSPLPAGNPLSQATHFLLSPDHRLLATDPQRGLWAAMPDGHGGRFLSGPAPRSCVLAQYTWLPDGSGLAYVQVCAVGQDALVRATLFSVRLDGSPPRQLYRATAADQQVIDLGPAYRCVLCGY